MARLLIGIPARNEAERIVELADRIESGATMLGASYDCRLALAYQTSDDDTLDRFTARPSRIPQVVLAIGAHARRQGRQREVARAPGAERRRRLPAARRRRSRRVRPVQPRARGRRAPNSTVHSLVLPLWSRPQGQGNTTNYLASPLVFASRRARVRQPLAGHMLLHRSLLERLDLDALPDDYGIDISITLTALDAGLSVSGRCRWSRRSIRRRKATANG